MDVPKTERGKAKGRMDFTAPPPLLSNDTFFLSRVQWFGG